MDNIRIELNYTREELDLVVDFLSTISIKDIKELLNKRGIEKNIIKTHNLIVDIYAILSTKLQDITRQEEEDLRYSFEEVLEKEELNKLLDDYFNR